MRPPRGAGSLTWSGVSARAGGDDARGVGLGRRGQARPGERRGCGEKKPGRLWPAGRKGGGDPLGEKTDFSNFIFK
jgi:hypothetical protein